MFCSLPLTLCTGILYYLQLAMYTSTLLINVFPPTREHMEDVATDVDLVPGVVTDWDDNSFSSNDGISPLEANPRGGELMEVNKTRCVTADLKCHVCQYMCQVPESCKLVSNSTRRYITSTLHPVKAAH